MVLQISDTMNIVNLEQPKNEIIKTLENKIKEGVDFVFEQNPELAKIGNKEQYSEYLDTIFPESKARDIVYHGTPYKFEKFERKPSRRLPDTFHEGYFFTPFLEVAKNYARDEKEESGAITHSVLIDIKNPKIARLYREICNLKIDDVDELRAENYDGVFYENNKPNQNPTEWLALDPDQIHILGFKQDIEKFKEFVSEFKSEEVVVKIDNQEDEQAKADLKVQAEVKNNEDITKVKEDIMNQLGG